MLPPRQSALAGTHGRICRATSDWIKFDCDKAAGMLIMSLMMRRLPVMAGNGHVSSRRSNSMGWPVCWGLKASAAVDVMLHAPCVPGPGSLQRKATRTAQLTPLCARPSASYTTVPVEPIYIHRVQHERWRRSDACLLRKTARVDLDNDVYFPTGQRLGTLVTGGCIQRPCKTCPLAPMQIARYLFLEQGSM